MRTMMKAHLDMNISNQKIRDGSLMNLIQSMMDQLQPEASYFYPEGGKRTFFMIFDMEEPSEIVRTAEPLFSELGAEVEFIPVMDYDDLIEGMTALRGPMGKIA